MTKETKASNKQKQENKKAQTLTPCYLVSKANHIVEVQCNGQIVYIQPFGKVNVIKEHITVNPEDAKYLTFIKA